MIKGKSARSKELEKEKKNKVEKRASKEKHIFLHISRQKSEFKYKVFSVVYHILYLLRKDIFNKKKIN